MRFDSKIFLALLMISIFWSCKNSDTKVTPTLSISIDPISKIISGKVEELIDNKTASDQAGWVAFDSPTLEGKIDLGAIDTLNTISMQFFNDSVNQIYPPKYVSLYFSYNDVDYNELPAFLVNCSGDQICQFSVPAAATKMRYVKFKIDNGHEGKKVMIDEISLN